MEETKIISSISEIKRLISNAFRDDIIQSEDEPFQVIYQQNISNCRYKITIQLLEEDFYIDSKGRKWIKVKDE